MMARGNSAKSLVEHDAFKAVVDELTSYHLSALVAAPPGKRGEDAREYHHLLQHALTELVGQLNGWIEAGEAAQRALDGAYEDEE